MQKMVGTTFLIITLTMLALAGGAYLAAKSYIDPTLKDLNRAVAAIQPEAQKELVPHLTELQRLREMGSLYVPSVLFLAGLTAMLFLSLLFRKLEKGGAIIAAARPRRAEVAIPVEQKRPAEGVERDLIDLGVCRILSLLQNKGRLIDFFQEDITGYPDAQVRCAQAAYSRAD